MAGLDDIDNMMKSVVRENKWIPLVVNDLLYDDADHFGIEFWYQDVVLLNKELKEKK